MEYAGDIEHLIEVGNLPNIDTCLLNLRGWLTKKNRHFLKNQHSVRGPISFMSKGKKRNVPNQDKQTPHTVLQKISPKMLRTP